MQNECLVTIVCCYNNAPMYEDFVRSLATQTCKYRLTGIDNRDSRFTSCSAAYNSVIRETDTEYVIYSHQDIRFPESDILEKFAGYLEKIGPDDILGVAGVKFDEACLYSNILHADSRLGKTVKAGNKEVNNLMECDTVDECFFGGHAGHFLRHPFDENLCDNWHLYAVERCLNTKLEGGNSVYICGVPLIHLSMGSLTRVFYDGFYRVCKHYSRCFPFIRTTCFASGTDSLRRTYPWFLGTMPFAASVRSAFYSIRRKISPGRALRRLGLRK